MIVKDNRKINPIISDEDAKSQKINLRAADGTDFGKISIGANSAIRGNYLNKYSPIDDDEKKALDRYKAYIEQPSKKQMVKDIIGNKSFEKHIVNNPNKTEKNQSRNTTPDDPQYPNTQFISGDKVTKEKQGGKLNQLANGIKKYYAQKYLIPTKLLDLTIKSLKRGYVQSLYGQESYKAMAGQKNNKAYYEEKLKSEDYSFIPDTWYEGALSGAMELLGQQVKQWTDPRSLAAGAAGAGMALAGGQMGPQVATPEEVVTIPGAFFVGITAGSTAANFEIEAGLAYNEMVENGVSSETARKIALGVGAGNAALEMIQLDDLAKSFKILNASKTTKPVAEKIRSYLIDRGVHVASETAQEVAQEAVTATGANVASKIDKGDWEYKWSELGKRLGETAASSATSFALLGVGGDAVKHVTNTQNKSVGKYYKDSAPDLVDIGLNQKTDTKAYKQATELKNKMDSGKTIKNAELGKYVSEMMGNMPEYERQKVAVAKNASNLIAREISNNGTKKVDTQGLYADTLNFLSDSNNTIDRDFVDKYANVFAKAMKDSGSVTYRGLEKATNGNVAQYLSNYIRNGSEKRDIAGETFKRALQSAADIRERAHNKLYGQNTDLSAKTEAIRNGDFSFLSDTDGNINTPKTESNPAVNASTGTDYSQTNINKTKPIAQAVQNENRDNLPGINHDKSADVHSVVSDTIYPELKANSIELFEKEYGSTGLSGLTDAMIANYKATGDIGKQEKTFFADNGEKVTRAIADTVKNERGGAAKNISDRTFEEVGSRKVYAYQYTYPQLKKYYSATANELLNDVQNTVKGERFVVDDGETRQYNGTKRMTSEALERIKDSTGASYAQISDALQRIINDSGQENIALAKRIELVMDDMLTDGYTAFDGTQIPPNTEYVAEKRSIEGTRGVTENGLQEQEEAAPVHQGRKQQDFLENAQNGSIGNTTGAAPGRENNAKNIDVPMIKDYEAAVDGILVVADETAKNMADRRIAVEILTHTPDVILQHVKEAKDLKIIMNYNKLYLAVRKDGVFKGHYHDLGAETAKKLPDFLKAPDAIIQLGNGRLNLFSTVTTKRGSNGIISVELNSTKDIGGAYRDYNVVVTMFSSDDQYVKNLIHSDGVTVKYAKEDLSQVNPQLYKWLAIVNDKSSSDNNTISQNSNVVNNNLSENTSEYTPKNTRTVQGQYRNRISAEEREAIAETSKALGVDVRIAQSLKGGEADGYYKNGTAYLAMDAEDKLMNVFSHEITHHFEDAAPESYAEYKQAVLEILARDSADTARGTDSTVETLIRDKQEKYARSGVNLSTQEVENELVADYTRRILNNPEQFQKFTSHAEHQGFLSKLLEAIREIFAKIKGKLTGKYDAQFAKTEQELQRVFDEAYRNKDTQSTSDGRYSFAGERALTADYTTLETAKAMQERGISNEEIFKNTGWFKGADNQWRFEINDKDLRVIETNPDFQKVQAASEQLQNAESEQERTAALNELRRAAQETQARGTFLKLPDVIQADALFEAYPFLRDIDVFYDFDSGSRASYYPGYNAISIDVMKNPTAQGQRRSFAHEIQHAIQEHEGFAIGANAELWNGDQKRYRNTAGELEAEDVKHRLDMTDEERSNTFPESAKENPERVFMDRDKVYGERMNEDDYTKSFSKTKITPDDVKAVQSIPRKSVNDFTSEDIKKTENFAKKYYSEMGEKSPFFRAWFGDWRANDTTPVKVANESGSARGTTKNIDTGWDIQISGKVFNETKSHNQNYNVKARPYLDYINSIVENAVLLDSYTVPSDKAKSSNSAMMHSLYAIADMGNGRELVKLYVEELNDVNSDGTIKRAYQLQNITKQQLNDRVQANALAPSASTADTYTVSQLFDLVKGLDKNFKPNEASKVVNEDGTPKIVYHGTDGEFTVFENMKTGKNFGDISSGMFFFTNYKEGYPNSAEDYARNSSKNNGGNPNIKEVYLDIKKPLRLDSRGYYSTNEYYDKNAEDIYMRFLDGDYDGVIIENSDKNADDSILYAVDNSKQIKSATDNIGTFDKGNDDIRYSLKENNISVNTEDIKNAADVKIEPLAWNSDENKSVHSINAAGSYTNNISQKDSVVNTNYVQDSEKYLPKENTIKKGNAIASNVDSNSALYVQNDNSQFPAGNTLSQKDDIVNTQDMRNSKKYSLNERSNSRKFVDSDNNVPYNIDIPYNEKRQLQDYIMRKNHSGKALENVGCKEIGNNFYVWKNNSKTDYTVIGMTEIDGNEDLIDLMRGEVENGNFRTRKGLRENVAWYNGRSRTRHRGGITDKEGRAEGGNGSISDRERADDRFGNSAKSRRNKQEANLNNDEKYSLREAIDTYRAIPTGEIPSREVEVPKKISEKQYVSRFARTMMESKAIPDDLVSEFEKSILDGTMTYEVADDKTAVRSAEQKIKEDGFQDSLAYWNHLNEADAVLKKQDLVLGQILLKECAANGDATNAMKIAADLALAYTEAGQSVQSARNLKRMTPDGQLYYIERTVQRLNKEFETKLEKNASKDVVKSQHDEESGDLYTSRKTHKKDLLERIRQAANQTPTESVERQIPIDHTKDYIQWLKDGELDRVKTAFDKLNLKQLTKDDIEFLRYVEQNYGKKIARYDMVNRGTHGEIKINEDYARQFLTAKSDKDRYEAYDRICQDIADQLPTSAMDRWNAWRYLAMLGNIRTHLRNISGNAVFHPVVGIKNVVGALIEKGFLKPEDRTKSLHKTKESLKYAEKDYEMIKEIIQGQGGKYVLTDDIRKHKKVFKTKIMNGVNNLNSNLLEAEDALFLKARYKSAFAQIMTARKITSEYLDSNTLESIETLNRIRALAIKEAQEATYRDANAVAEALTKIQTKAQKSDNRMIRGLGYAVEGVIPFKKTPLNIVARGVEYSPIGLINGLIDVGTEVRKGKMTGAEAINEIAKGIVGTGLVVLGYGLAHAGLLTGSDDEDSKKRVFDTLVGKQGYALTIGGKSYTIDSFAPENMPLFVGAELYKLLDGDGLSFSQTLNAISTISEPALELSCLSGIASTIESAQYNNTNTIAALVTDIATSYICQALPTLGGQVARIIDRTKYNAYYRDKTSDIPVQLQTFIAKVGTKVPIPPLSKLLFEPKIDKWGRTMDYGDLPERIFENTISPGYYSEERYTAVDRELERLYNDTGDNTVLPRSDTKNVTIDKVRYNLNASQFTKFAKLKGSKSLELLNDLFSDNMKMKLGKKKNAPKLKYSKMSDEEKIKAIEKCYDEAMEYAKSEMKDEIVGGR